MRLLFKYMSKKVIKNNKKEQEPIRRNFITNLHIKNFKSFFGPVGSQEINVKLAPKITLLFGKNSAGKSSLLQAIKLIQQSYDNGDDMVTNPASTYSGALAFPTYKDLVSKKETVKSISLGLTTEECLYKNNKRLETTENRKTIIKKFSYRNNKILCDEIDYYSPSDDAQKFISIKNRPYNAKGIEDYYKSDISFFENKYAWKELFKYTYKYRNKVIPYLQRCIEFSDQWTKLIKNKKKSKENVDREIDKIVGQAGRPGVFSPVHFVFLSKAVTTQHIKFLNNMRNDYDSFIKYIADDVKKNKNFLYKNNKTFNSRQIFELININLESSDRKKIFSSLRSYSSLSDLLCFVVSSLCGSKYPVKTSFDPNNPSDKEEREKTLHPKKMIDYCNDMVSSSIKRIRVFQGQKALPTQYENTRSPEKDFVGYNYEFLHEVISDHKKKIDKWLTHFGYDFKIDTESGGPTSVTLVQHRKKGFKVDYKQGGLGAENILPIIAQSVAAKNKVLIFEEPERRAHPRLQSKMADLIVECSKNNQFIIETHSENLLLGILKNIRDGKISHKDVQVSYVHIDKDQSKVDELRIDEKGNFESNWRDGFFTERLDLL